MADRSGYENNDFTGGISDQYVPAKDNFLDAGENICLDDDLAVIQRPGSGPLDGATASTAGRASGMTKIVGLAKNDEKIVAATENKVWSYDRDAGGDFEETLNRSGYALNVPVSYDQGNFTVTDPATPVTGGSVGMVENRNEIYFTSSKLAFPQKLILPESEGEMTRHLPLGISRALDVIRSPDEDMQVYEPELRGNFLLQIVQYTYSDSPPGGILSKPTAGGTPITGEGKNGTWWYSDKPYTYEIDRTTNKETVVKNNWAHKYLFTYCFKITYTVNGVEFEKRGSPCTPFWILSDTALGVVHGSGTYTETQISLRVDMQAHQGMFTQMNMPRLLKNEGLYPETANNLKTEIESYVTEDNGSVLYLSDTLITTSFGGSLPPYEDGSLPYVTILSAPYRVLTDNKEAIYTTGGVKPNDPPPGAKYLFQAGTYTFFLNISELSFEFIETDMGVVDRVKWTPVPYRGKMSKDNDPDSVPEGHLIETPDAMMGGGAVLDRAIVGTTREIYRVDGRYDNNGAGLVNMQLLSSETGLLSHKSCISVKDKMFFCGDDGIYMTDGVQVICISRHLARIYRLLVSSVVTDGVGKTLTTDREAMQELISATYDRRGDRVIFSFGTKCLVLELRAGDLSNGFGAFYGPWYNGFNPSSPAYDYTALGICDDLVLRGDEDGYVFRMSPGYLSDPNQSHPTAANLWGRLPILYRVRTAKYAFGSLAITKWVNFLTFILKRRQVISDGVANIDVQVNAYNDGEKSREELKPFHYAGQNDDKRDENPKVGYTPVPKVVTDTIVSGKRRFGFRSLRCFTKAVEFTNGRFLVGKSDNYENGLVSGNQVSLPNHPTYSWPKESQDLSQKNYVIAFDYDNYATKFVVTAGTAATLTLNGSPTAGSHKWKLYSFSSAQFFGLHSLAFVFTVFAGKNSPYETELQGGNSGDNGE